MSIDNVTPELARRLRLDNARGAVITDVEEDSPAAPRGLRPGDVIIRVGSVQPSPRPPTRSASWVALPSGGTALLRIIRPGEHRATGDLPDGDEGVGLWRCQQALGRGP